MTRIPLSQSRTVAQIIQAPEIIDHIGEAASLAPKGISGEEYCEEFLSCLRGPARLGAHIGYKLAYKYGESIGIKNTTNRKTTLKAPYGYGAASLLSAIAKQGCSLDTIEEEAAPQRPRLLRSRVVSQSKALTTTANTKSPPPPYSTDNCMRGAKANDFYDNYFRMPKPMSPDFLMIASK